MTDIFDNLAEPYDRWYDQPADAPFFAPNLLVPGPVSRRGLRS